VLLYVSGATQQCSVSMCMPLSNELFSAHLKYSVLLLLCSVSLLSDQSVLASAMLSVTDDGGSTAALARQVDLLERRNAELEQKLLGKSV